MLRSLGNHALDMYTMVLKPKVQVPLSHETLPFPLVSILSSVHGLVPSPLIDSNIRYAKLARNRTPSALSECRPVTPSLISALISLPSP